MFEGRFYFVYNHKNLLCQFLLGLCSESSFNGTGQCYNTPMNTFEDVYTKLNSAQKQAVDAIEGPVMVVAGPGTGKTQILTLRIANILKETQANPENILALTFTESGVASMRKRLVEMIGSEAYRVHITTFHSFANDIIRDYPEYFPHIIGSNAIVDVEQVQIIEKLILDTKLDLLKPFGDNLYYVRSVMSAIKSLKREGVTPEEFEKVVKEEQEHFDAIEDLYHEKGAHKGKMKGKYTDLQKKIHKNKELALLYATYQEALQTRKVYDFEDMIVETLGVLRKEQDLLVSLQEQYQYVLVDEHQDTNNAQNKILELLLNFHDNPNIFIVGDEKQAIFRFQGASLENFYYFKHLYPEAQLISLEENYRSTQRILDTAYSLQPKDAELKASGRGDDHPVHVYALKDQNTEMEFVARQIKKLVDEKVTPSEIAILYRDNKDAYDLVPFLEKHDISHVVESDTSIFSEPVVKKALTLFQAIWHLDENEYVARALHLDLFDIPALDAFKLIRSAAQKRKKLLADLLVSEKEQKELTLENPEEVIEFGKDLASWSKQARNEDLVSVVGAIIHDAGIVRRAVEDGVEGALGSLEVLFDEVKKLVARNPEADLGDFLAHVQTIQEHNLLLKKKNAGIDGGKVRLMTAHRSKGLEFEYVFIIHTYNGHFGGKKRRETLALLPRVYKLLDTNIPETTDDDERNLFYVALTRAKKAVHITYPKESVEGKELLPSVFIHDLREDLVEQLEPNVKFSKSEVITRPNTKTSPSLSKEFVRHIFTKQGLSVTALNNYLKSPWQYFYQNLIRIPQVPNKHQSYGTAVHAALADLFNALKKDETVSKAWLLKRFNEKLSDQWFTDHDQVEAKIKGEKALGAWFDEYSSDWITNTLNEYRINDVLLSEDVRLVGVLDKLEFLGPQEVNVVDYKTGKPRTQNHILGKTKDSSGDYYRQLVFYKLLLGLHADSKYRLESGEIDFIEPDAKGNMHKEKFSVSDDDVLDLKEQILQVSDEILNLKFLGAECDPEKCDYCDLVDLIK